MIWLTCRSRLSVETRVHQDPLRDDDDQDVHGDGDPVAVEAVESNDLMGEDPGGPVDRARGEVPERDLAVGAGHENAEGGMAQWRWAARGSAGLWEWAGQSPRWLRKVARNPQQRGMPTSERVSS